jgi:hypothetical protein
VLVRGPHAPSASTHLHTRFTHAHVQVFCYMEAKYNDYYVERTSISSVPGCAEACGADPLCLGAYVWLDTAQNPPKWRCHHTYTFSAS